jgi:hypothetical protein
VSRDRRAQLRAQRADRAVMRDRAAKYARELAGTDEGNKWARKAEALASEIYDIDKTIARLARFGGGS